MVRSRVASVITQAIDDSPEGSVLNVVLRGPSLSSDVQALLNDEADDAYNVDLFMEQIAQVLQRNKRLEMATPVSVLRLPKGPDPNSRGFDPKSPRFIALCRTSIPSSSDAEQLPGEQHARSVLRESFLRCLLAMANKKIQFQMYERVKVEATFRASDIDVLNFQVSDLHTPIGVQKEALIRCQDVISFTFDA
ncbi:hypothetical protein VZT92_020755 [Zoarces viviparus]|uniref:SUZ-C domain-containing protein n=1 Tax=Zoarces viviparus TaxID=48416 RepID=A0AAW1EG25_ZOAVI